jgi:hypothetical protein
MALNDIIRLTFQQRQFNQLIQNVLHFRVNNILKGPADLLAQFDTFIGSEWKNHQMNSVEYVLLTAQVVLPPSEDLFSRVPTTTTAAINGASVPGQVAATLEQGEPQQERPAVPRRMRYSRHLEWADERGSAE